MSSQARLLLPLTLFLIGCNAGIFDSNPDQVALNPTVEKPTNPVGELPPAVETPDATPPAAWEEFRVEVTHRYFPLAPGTVWVLTGNKESAVRVDEMRVLHQTTVIDGVTCTAVRQEVYLDNILTEVTTEWYAQDGDGNVWKFGEQTFELEDGIMQYSIHSWKAGEDGAARWMLFGADPQPGDVFGGPTPEGADVYEVTGLGTEAAVPAGLFQGCMDVVENAENPDDADKIIYAPGVGMISEESIDGKIELASIRKE